MCLRTSNFFKSPDKFFNSIQTAARQNKSDLKKIESHCSRPLVSAANTKFESKFEKFRLNSKGKKTSKANHLDLISPIKGTQIFFLFRVLFICFDRNDNLGRNLDLFGRKNIFGFLIF